MLLVVLLAAGCSRSTETPERPIATVDGLPLYEDDFKRSYVDYLVTTGQNDTQGLRRRHYDALVDAYLLGAEADRRGLDDDPELIERALRARRDLIGSRYFEMAALDSLPPVTEAEAREAFTRDNEQRVVRQLFFRDPAAADAAFARLQNGRSFLEEAQDLYGTTDPLAGSLGAITYWQLDDAFAEAAYATPVGAYSRPVRSRLGYHIVYVEDRLRNPVLSEDEFIRRRKGIVSQIRLRRGRLVGDQYVRSFMEAREVAVQPRALLELTRVLRGLQGELEPDARQGAPQGFTAMEKAEIQGELPPETPLATFRLGGTTHTFTVADYLFWLDALPSKEARNRPGASLGRALSNEALALAGEAAGVQDDPAVQHELARLQRLRLSDALRRRLRADAPAAPDTARLDQLARDLKLVTRRTLVDYWQVPYPTRAAADAGLALLAASPDRAPSQPGFATETGQDLRSVPSLASALRAAPVGRPVLAAAGDAWAVVQVSDRQTVTESTDGAALAPLAAEADLVRHLRQAHPFKADAELLKALTTPAPVPSRSF